LGRGSTTVPSRTIASSFGLGRVDLLERRMLLGRPRAKARRTGLKVYYDRPAHA